MTKKIELINKLCQKATTKQQVYRTTQEVFEDLKKNLEQIAIELNEQMQNIDKFVKIEYEDKGPFEAKLQFSGDVLIFHFHSNTFKFDKNHHIWNHSYTKNNEYNAYCGVISIYNFLSDSFKYNRVNDLGHLIGRIFINKENHFFVEGKGKLNFLFNDFANAVIDREILRNILYEAVLFAMDFELTTPPFNEVNVVTLHQIKEMSHNMKLKTAKRLGYRFSKEK